MALRMATGAAGEISLSLVAASMHWKRLGFALAYSPRPQMLARDPRKPDMRSQQPETP